MTCLTVLMVFVGKETAAQQQVQYTQYMYNTMSVNPGYTGTSGRLEAFLMHRSQWVGIQGAPNSQNLGVQGAITNLLGLGLNVTNDRIGPANDILINASVAARIPLFGSTRLSVGLNGGMDVLNVDWAQGEMYDVNDQSLNSNIQNRVRPLIGAGVYLYGEKWYAGVSSPNFIRKDQYGNLGEARINSNVHWYIIGGYIWSINERLKFKPAVMGKLVQGAPVTLDLSANFLLNEKFTLGAAYRFNDAVSLLAGLTLKRAFFIGYAYDITVTKLRNYSSGSHDIMFRYTLFDKEQHARSPRFF